MITLEVWRFYELAWQNMQGLPEYAVLEMSFAKTPTGFDGQQLKSKLNELAARRFADHNVLCLQIQELLVDICGQLPILSLIHSNNFSQKNLSLAGQSFVQVPIYPFDVKPCKESQAFFLWCDYLRFLCPKSGQPYVGHVWCHCLQNEIDPTILQSMVAGLNSQHFCPNTLLEPLYLALQEGMEKPPLVMSVHLARRGGLSYQGLVTEHATDLSSYICRMAVE